MIKKAELWNEGHLLIIDDKEDNKTIRLNIITYPEIDFRIHRDENKNNIISLSSYVQFSYNNKEYLVMVRERQELVYLYPDDIRLSLDEFERSVNSIIKHCIPSERHEIILFYELTNKKAITNE